MADAKISHASAQAVQSNQEIPVVVRTVHEQSRVSVIVDASNVALAAGSFELTYDAKTTRLMDCALTVDGACNIDFPGVVTFNFVDAAGFSGNRTVTELTFSDSGFTISSLRVVSLVDNSLNNIEHDVVLEQGSGIAQQTMSGEIFLPFISRRNFKRQTETHSALEVDWACLLDAFLLHTPETDRHPVMQTIKSICQEQY